MDSTQMIKIAKSCAESAVKAFSVTVTVGIVKEVVEGVKDFVSNVAKAKVA